ncbi:GSCFA family protein [Synechococcus sp. A15-62]|uniref:GSCFA domain-containing protein n=1 Tax=Synechococcus sp. A15-62 TaxID=1050657 RepID=UPI001648C086|nr:GSCFA domain-containing protein [Synechococcus sp. A15-62]QNI99018.1 GSCFA family protein [Synechococcus sp. A15-62]
MNPYEDLPEIAFWKTGVFKESPFFIKDIYKKKFNISSNSKIASAGSCFAQHIADKLKISGFNFLDTEIAPAGFPPELCRKYGYGMYSSRYGNIYNVLQLRQLADEALGSYKPDDYIWRNNGRYYDAIRPSIQPQGFDSPEEVEFQRQCHIDNVRKMFKQLDVFIFTLGLTEVWVNKKSNTAYPIAPGVIAGGYNPDNYHLINTGFNDIISDFNSFQQSVKQIRSGRPFKIILTVSPVPLTATATGRHVLAATCYSKSILRAVAGHLYEKQAHVDYFPSYELITNPRSHSTFFSDNLRTIRSEAVESVMKHFFAEHKPHVSNISKQRKINNQSTSSDKIQCEEALLEAFRQ